jgi:hypothetical protein
MPNDPSILTAPTGPQFLTAPDGAVVYRNDGTPVDLTGVPLTSGPNRTGTGASISSSDPALLPGQLLVTGLYNTTPDLVGVATIHISNAGSPTPAPGAIPKNNGSFTIIGLGTASPSESVIIANALGSAPDINDGNIEWAIEFGQDFAPLYSEGNPLAEMAERVLPLNVNTPQPAPMTFGAYNPTLPPLTVNDSAGLFNKVQPA